MTLRIIVLITCFPLMCPAQSMLTMLAEGNGTIELSDQILSYESTTYIAIDMFGVGTPDTLLSFRGKELELYQSATGTRVFLNAQESKTVAHYPNENVHTSIDRYDEDGRPVFSSLDVGDSPAASMMNFNQEWVYNDRGQVTMSTKNQDTVFQITYRDNGLVDAAWMDVQVMGMKFTSEDRGDTIVYRSKADIDPELAQLFGGDLPSETVYLTHDEGLYTYRSLMRESDTSAATLNEVLTCDINWKPTEKMSYFDGEKISHTKYLYDEGEKLTALHDVLEDKVLQHEFDQVGNLLVEKGDTYCYYYEYDDRGNKIQEVQQIGCDGDLVSITFFEFRYR